LVIFYFFILENNEMYGKKKSLPSEAYRSGGAVVVGVFVIAALIALAFGLAYGGASSSQLCKPGFATCDNTGTKCGTSLLVDNLNCGACGSVCPLGSLCTDGVCLCQAPLVGCNDRCVDIKTDILNCGTCGRICSATGAVCSNGVCECPNSQTDCIFNCAYLNNSTLDCGDCGVACAIGQSCNSGVCECPIGEVVCNVTGCARLSDDVRNCGACGSVCPQGIDCINSVCNCPSGEVVCGDSCVSLTNTSNCGVCGNNCLAKTNSTGVCSSETCTPCPTFFRNCNAQLGQCSTPVQSDSSNCGDCNVTCTSSVTLNGFCSNGTCDPCPSGTGNCALDFGVCATNLNTDNQNCGTCSNVCTNGNVCFNGVCECTGVCNCTGGTTRCGVTCVDTNTDFFNCGSCNTICPYENQVCQNATCICPPPSILCGNTCVNPLTESRNCGTCGNDCTEAPTFGRNLCVDGVCINCTFPFQTCDNTQAFCAQNILTDVFNCGRCNNPCLLTQNVVETACDNGNCMIIECDFGYADCNGIYSDGCESPSCTCCSGNPLNPCFNALSPGDFCNDNVDCKSNDCSPDIVLLTCRQGIAGACCTSADDCLSLNCFVAQRICL
jgi:hypothetical protein